MKTRKLSEKGFGAFEGLLLIIAVTLIVGVGYYVVNVNKGKDTDQATKTSTSNESVSVTEPKLTQYEFAQEKLKFSYDDNYWEVKDQSSGSIDCSVYGQLKQDTLSLKHDDFTLSFRFGQCPGKGGGGCFSAVDSGCIAESRNLGEVKVGTDKTWYIQASRKTIDYGKTWKYTLWLDDESNCVFPECLVSATNIDDELSMINGFYINDTNIDSLDQYIRQSEVEAAIQLFKSATY